MHRLRVESGERSGERIPLPESPSRPIRVGRAESADVCFGDDARISREHAELRFEDGRWVLVNLAQHGTRVGWRTVRGRRRLRAGDLLVLGETEVAFERVSGPASGAEAPATLTPRTPTVATPAAGAGFDSAGVFHTGDSLLGPAAEAKGSVLRLGAGDREGALRIKTRRLYFLLVVLLLGLAGALATALLIVVPALPADPAALLLPAAYGLLPALPYLLLIKLLDRNDQIPWVNLVACVAWGGTVGCGLSLVLNAAGANTLSALVAHGAAADLTAFVVAPVTEECAKGLAVLVVFWILPDELDNALEGIVLGAASGLGFALVENCVYNLRFSGDELASVATYRALGNALVGHPIYTAMTGAGLGLLRALPRAARGRLFVPLAGLGAAIALHVAWNGAAINLARFAGGSRGLGLHAVVFGGGGLVFFAAVYLFAAARERRVLLTYLAEELDAGFVTVPELATFRQLLGRVRHELASLWREGRAVYRVRRALRRAQVELGFRKWHLAHGETPRGDMGHDLYVVSARNRIRDARNALSGLDSSSGGAGAEAV